MRADIKPDKTLSAMQDISYNQKAMATAASAIKLAEQELDTLTNIGLNTGKGWIRPTGLENRANHLLAKMQDNEKKLEKLEQANSKLKAVLKEE
jgi:hypothetical protein